MGKPWTEMSEAERAEINRQEDARESYKDAMSGWESPSDAEIEAQESARESYKDALADSDKYVGLATEPSDEDLAEWMARMEERADGSHHDSLYW